MHPGCGYFVSRSQLAELPGEEMRNSAARSVVAPIFSEVLRRGAIYTTRLWTTSMRETLADSDSDDGDDLSSWVSCYQPNRSIEEERMPRGFGLFLYRKGGRLPFPSPTCR